MASLSVSELRLGYESLYIVVELQLKSSVYTIERAAQYSFLVLQNSLIVGSLKNHHTVQIIAGVG